nr:glycoside hydrolase family 3 C-terminal domain-containing protein [Bacteroidota bacterium]
WSAAGDAEKCVTIIQGIKNKVPDANIFYTKGCEVEGNDQSGFSRAASLARRSDVVILAIGETAGMSGEACSRSEITIPGVQEKLTEVLLATGKPIVVVLSNGRPLDLSWLDEHAPAILETWFLGTTSGDAIADVMFGDYNPSGKLSVTFPRKLGQVPLFYNTKNTGRPKTDVKWTSKYLDVPNTPLYPFGYGLSYTTFDYSKPVLSGETMTRDGSLTVAVDITNTGQYEGEEVVQLYVRDLVGSVTRPLKELKGFEKISLEPGETKRVEFIVNADDLQFLDINMEWVVEPGEFEIFVGTDSEDTKSVMFSVTD